MTMDTDSRRSLLSQLAFHPNRPHLLIGVLFLVLGLLVTIAILRPGTDEPWRTARTEDLVQILDDLGARQDRLEAESARLTALERDLEAGSQAQAIAEAQRRLTALQVLAGTTPVSGPGVQITISDPTGVIEAPTILDAIQELRDAGAEAIQVGTERVVVDTWLANDPGGISVSGTPVASPYRILAIGDPETMLSALNIPGGVADSVRTRGAEFAASQAQEMTISVTVPETAS
ncbi:MAG: DUF881 domain-containing protein [Actinomycetales bacterium]|nr:DUF881 domain-containing protein [Actinomycetales bacterium]